MKKVETYLKEFDPIYDNMAMDIVKEKVVFTDDDYETLSAYSSKIREHAAWLTMEDELSGLMYTNSDFINSYTAAGANKPKVLTKYMEPACYRYRRNVQ